MVVVVVVLAAVACVISSMLMLFGFPDGVGCVALGGNLLAVIPLLGYHVFRTMGRRDHMITSPRKLIRFGRTDMRAGCGGMLALQRQSVSFSLINALLARGWVPNWLVKPILLGCRVCPGMPDLPFVGAGADARLRLTGSCHHYKPNHRKCGLYASI
jgi:hypothetical protein